MRKTSLLSTDSPWLLFTCLVVHPTDRFCGLVHPSYKWTLPTPQKSHWNHQGELGPTKTIRAMNRHDQCPYSSAIFRVVPPFCWWKNPVTSPHFVAQWKQRGLSARLPWRETRPHLLLKEQKGAMGGKSPWLLLQPSIYYMCMYMYEYINLTLNRYINLNVHAHKECVTWYTVWLYMTIMFRITAQSKNLLSR